MEQKVSTPTQPPIEENKTEVFLKKIEENRAEVVLRKIEDIKNNIQGNTLELMDYIAEVKRYHIKEIRFYASVPSIEDGEETYYNHIAYLDSLRKKGVNVITRKLQRLSNKEISKRRQETINNLDLCDVCKPLVEANFLDLSDIKRKEKGIDVWIAVDMLRLAVIENDCEVCVLISGDADFVPALDIVKAHGKEFLTAMTPYGYSRELREPGRPYFILKEITLLKCFRDYKGRTIK